MKHSEWRLQPRHVNPRIQDDKHPCVLKINATQAYQDGINFYYGNEKVWLADEIPSKYITEM